MTWHNIALATIGVATGIGGFLIPGATVFTTPAAYMLIGGALGLAVPGMVPGIAKLLTTPATPPATPPAPKS